MQKHFAVFLIVVSAVFGAQLHAAVIPPIGLAPGSQYQLIFVTIATTTATSANIDDYNALVNTEAAIFTGPGPFGPGLPSGVHWHAVASTPTANANENAPSLGLPVYNTLGQLVAASNLYMGSLLTGVTYDETGIGFDVDTAAVWTGSDALGLGVPGHTLGDPGGTGVVGFAGGQTSVWMEDHDTVLFSNNWALYALSDPITFLPEPSTLVLAALGLGGLVAMRWRRRSLAR